MSQLTKEERIISLSFSSEILRLRFKSDGSLRMRILSCAISTK